MEKFQKIWNGNVMFIVWADKEKTVSGLKLSRKDLRYIDKDFQESLMLEDKNITDNTIEYRNQKLEGWMKYKK